METLLGHMYVNSHSFFVTIYMGEFLLNTYACGSFYYFFILTNTIFSMNENRYIYMPYRIRVYGMETFKGADPQIYRRHSKCGEHGHKNPKIYVIKLPVNECMTFLCVITSR